MFWLPPFLLKSQLSVFLLLLWRISFSSFAFKTFLLCLSFTSFTGISWYGFLCIFSSLTFTGFLKSLALITSISFRKVDHYVHIFLLHCISSPHELQLHRLACQVLGFFILFSVLFIFPPQASVLVFPVGLLYSSAVTNLLNPSILVLISITIF